MGTGNTALANAGVYDESFDLNNPSNYFVSILLGKDTSSYAVLEPVKNKYVVLAKLNSGYGESEKIRNELSSLSWIEEGSRCVLSVIEPRSTLVPSPLFDEQDWQKYLALNFGFVEGMSPRFDYLKTLDTYCIYYYPNEVKKSLPGFLSETQILHSSSSLLECLSMYFKNRKGKHAVININSSRFDLVIFTNGKLFYYNSFTHETTEDFIYNILFTFEQLKVNPDNVPVTMLGEIESNSAIHEILEKYIRNIEFGSRPESFKYSYRLEELSSHNHFNLYSQYLCV